MIKVITFSGRVAQRELAHVRRTGACDVRCAGSKKELLLTQACAKVYKAVSGMVPETKRTEQVWASCRV